MHVLLCGSETMIYRKKERSRIGAVKIDNIKGLLGIWRINRVPNEWIRELCLVKGVDGSVLYWYSHTERMEIDRIAKRLYVVEHVGSSLESQPWKR